MYGFTIWERMTMSTRYRIRISALWRLTWGAPVTRIMMNVVTRHGRFDLVGTQSPSFPFRIMLPISFPIYPQNFSSCLFESWSLAAEDASMPCVGGFRNPISLITYSSVRETVAHLKKRKHSTSISLQMIYQSSWNLPSKTRQVLLLLGSRESQMSADQPCRSWSRTTARRWC